MVNNKTTLDLSKVKFDIILQAGQSNAEGCGRGEVECEYAPTDDILYLNNERDVITYDGGMSICYKSLPMVVSVADYRSDGEDKIGDFALTFAQNYKNEYLAPDRKILIIRSAIGGTGFSGGQWKENDTVYRKMREMVELALSLNPENKVVALLWHQGEHDSVWHATSEYYYEKLGFLIDKVRSDYATEDLPFVVADFVNEWKSKNEECCAPVISAMRKLALDKGGAFVETLDLPSNNQKVGNGDDIHFCRNSLAILGGRYFDAYKSIRK
ncbi:MAG: hypothetical protein IJY70_04105 [Clostridia bacterium]|nr:hypothetical protein [Clostridia bacterium]